MPLFSSVVLAAALAANPATPEAAPPPLVSVHGYVSASVFAQDHSFGFGNGQSAEFAANGHTTDPWMTGGDVRNSRLTLSFTPPPLSDGVTVSGVLELDFFGGFNGAGAMSDEQPLPRLRLAYVDLTWGWTSVRVGQAFAPLLGNVPVSTSHLAFAIGVGSTGVLGWRFPGVFVTQHLLRGDALGLKLQLAALRGSWAGPGNNLDQLSAGETASIPQLEARLEASGRRDLFGWTAHVVGHQDLKDRNGTDPDAGAPAMVGRAVSGGVRLTYGPWLLHGNGYWGEAVGHHFGNLAQFGDLRGSGGWAQLGYDWTPNWSTFAFAGLEQVNEPDAWALSARDAAAARQGNVTYAAMLRFRQGAYQVGLEWMRVSTRWVREATETTAAESPTHHAQQFSLSVLLTF